MMQQIEGGVTAAKGFEAAAVAAKIKYQDRTDMALVYSQRSCVAAGAFTQNIVKAAPVKWDQTALANGTTVKALVVNSGIANACTGEEGARYCDETAKITAAELGIEPNQVLIGSTGVIGKQLPMDRITEGIKELCQQKNCSLASGAAAAKAIMTTDTYAKEMAVTFEINKKAVTIGGMAKGSGMIHPNMCTMLSFITTDANISQVTLQKVLSADVEDTYNMISVDGDTSTNDTVIVLANGAAENEEIKEGTEAYEVFAKALNKVNEYLAKQIAGDGEGATALFEVKLIGASSIQQAKTLAKAVVCSSLTKTALAGHDANWGRILCAMGYAGASFQPEKVKLFFESSNGTIQIAENGMALLYSEEEATAILSAKHVTAILDIQEGSVEATAWGCDLTHGYISINADYRS